VSHPYPTTAGTTHAEHLCRHLALAALLLMAAVAMIARPATSAELPDSFAPLVEKLSPAVVNISTVQNVEQSRRSPFPPGSPFEEFFEEFFGQPRGDGGGDGDDESRTRRLRSLGSGFFIDPAGYIVTNDHVIDQADEITVRLSDDTEYDAEIVGRDPELDLALLKIDADGPVATVEWGDSDGSRVGDWVLAIGNPFGIGRSVTVGIISAHHRDITNGPFEDFIQTDASINRGNSGGPMFNLDGKVIGINTAIFSPTGGNIGIGFAIPSSQARNAIEQLKEFGRPRRGYIGVTIGEVDELTAEALGLEEARGALINSVEPGGPGDEAGLKPGDIILSFNGESIADTGELVRAVSNAGVGETVELELLRDNGERETVEMTTALRPINPGQPGETPAPSEPEGSAGLGVNLRDITPTVRQQFELPPEVSGAVVVRLTSAELRGRLQRGDVITEVNRNPVDSAADVRQQVAAVREAGKSAALLRIYRGGEYYFIPVPLEDGEG